MDDGSQTYEEDDESQEPPPPPRRNDKKSRAKSTVFIAEKVKEIPTFTCDQLVDLALCAPEVGAVNFNILRMLLHDLVRKTGARGEPARLTELDAHQADNFRRYLDGMNVASPMPGVLRIGPQHRQSEPILRQPQSSGGGGKMPLKGPQMPIGGSAPSTSRGRKSFFETATGEDDHLAGKVQRLEKQLDALNDLPTNEDLIAEAKEKRGKSISVGEMWQIIQLNNRIAAAEAAIQKMASLIEDLARNLGKVKFDMKSSTKSTKELELTSSDLQLQGNELVEKYGQVDDVINAMMKDMSELKQGWKQDRENMQRILGIDLGKLPAFMKDRPPMLFRRPPPPPGARPGPPPDEAERATQTFQKDRPPPPKKHIAVPPEEIMRLSATEIMEKVTPEDLTRMTPQIYKQLSMEQKKALGNIRRSVKLPEPPKMPLGVANMSDEELAELDPQDILEKMPFEEALHLTQSVLDRMTDQQREMVTKVIKRGPAKRFTSRKDLRAKREREKAQVKKKKMGMISMTSDQLKELRSKDVIQKTTYDEAKNIPPHVLEKMRQSVQDALQEILKQGPPDGYEERSPAKSIFGLASMDKSQLGEITPEDIEGMTYSEAKHLPQEIIEQLTPEQQEALQRVLDAGQREGSLDDEYDDDVDEEEPSDERKKSKLSNEEIEMVAELPPYEIAEVLSPQEAASIPDEVMEKRFTKQQIDEIHRLQGEEGRKSGRLSRLSRGGEEETSGEGEEETYAEEEEQTDQVQDTDRDSAASDQGEEEEERKRRPSARRHRGGKDKKHKHHKGRKSEKRHGKSLAVHISDVPVVEPPPPVTLEEYLGTLTAEEAANLAADAVQREMEKQYRQLQGLQQQMAMDIQEKMEFIYEKLLKEIGSQQMTTTPFNLSGPETCFGPGICPGQHMPAGITVVQQSDGKEVKSKAVADEVVQCPGPGPCPGPDVCPYCIAAAKAKEALKDLKEHEDKGGKPEGAEVGVDASKQTATTAAQGASDVEGLIHEEMQNLMLLDLEKIRQEMRTKKFGAYDEQDILERLGAVWEALKILRNNEESLALKVMKQDVLMKKISPKAIEKLHKIPEENLEALITGDFGKIAVHGHHDDRRGTLARGPALGPHIDFGGGPTTEGGEGAKAEEIQTLFENLSNVILECADQKERIDQISDTARVLEASMVTKKMLLDAMSDKADRGLINTKVSYDEFGTTVEEINTQLHTLVTESFQRNETLKKVTSDLAAELALKLDRVELAPLRAYFKGHLKGLEEQVQNLTKALEEPDPAGTRKKILRDCNCLSCDRVARISGATNAPTLPTIGPIQAGHPTNSKLALDAQKHRMRKQCDKMKSLAYQKKQAEANRIRKSVGFDQGPLGPHQVMNYEDMMNVVNRYTGGSHTVINTGDNIMAARRSQQVTNPDYLVAAARGNNFRKCNNVGNCNGM